MSYQIDLNLGWNAGARSRKLCVGDCQARFSVPDTNSGAVVGFNTEDLGSDFREIKHALFFQRLTTGGTRVLVYESGVQVYTGSSYVTADIFTIRRNGTVVKYFQNDTLLYTSATPSTGAVFLDTSLYAGGDSV